MTTTAPETTDVAGLGIPFSVASRPQRRFSAQLTTGNNSQAGSFPIVQLAATGWVRKVSLFFEQTVEFASAGAVTGTDGPFPLVRGVTLTDATGQPVMQPITGFQLYLVNKYCPGSDNNNALTPYANPMQSPEYQYGATATTGTATFRLDIVFEVDHRTGYGCVPNLDSNASLQLKVDYAPVTSVFTGVTPANGSLAMRVETDYWAPVASAINGMAVDAQPPGVGDYVETRYETQTVSPSSENLVQFTNRGGLVKNVILVSRNAGTRVAFTPKANVGILLDNQPINEGIPLESHYNQARRAYGYNGADINTNFAPITAGVDTGLDTGVIVLPFMALSGGRDSWLNTRAGSLFQAKITPGAGAGTLEIITQMAQVKEAGAFYNVGVS